MTNPLSNVALSALSLRVMAEVYNSTALTPVNKFSSRAEAERRVEAELERVDGHLYRADDGVVTVVVPDARPAGEVADHETVTEEELETELEPETETVTEEPAAAPAAKEDPIVAAAPAGVAAQVRALTEKRRAGQQQRGPKSAYDDHMVIRVLVPNPRRAGQASHARFALYKDGMTVRQYMQAVADWEGGAWQDQRVHVRWDAVRGHIAVEAARG